MIGAIIGDIAGSRFEFNNFRHKWFDPFAETCFFTDDTVMTLALCKAVIETVKQCHHRPLDGDAHVFDSQLSSNAVRYMREIGREYPDCGYGGRFQNWIFSRDPQPYHSFGNGAAMRVSAVGWLARTEEEAISLSKIVTSVTHDHPEGIKGAEATAVAIFMARKGATRKQIRQAISSRYYPLDFRIDSIRDTYAFNETCQETVPQAIEAFLESESFDDAIRIAVSVGGDSDTLAAITGSIAEAYYGVPTAMLRKALVFLDDRLRAIYKEWKRFIKNDPCRAPYHVLTKYIGHWEAAKQYEESHHRIDGWLSRNEVSESFMEDFEGLINANLSMRFLGPKSKLKEYCTLPNLNEVYRGLDDYDAAGIVRMIWIFTHSNRYVSGLDEAFFEEGVSLACVKRMKALYPQKGKLEYVEISAAHTDTAKCFVCRMCLAENGATLTFTQKGADPKRIPYTAQEVSDWLEAYGAIHTEHWNYRYADRASADGIRWRVVEKRVGWCETVWEGCDRKPVNMDRLLSLMQIDDKMSIFDRYQMHITNASAINEMELLIESCNPENNGVAIFRSERMTVNHSEGSFHYACQDGSVSHSASWTDLSKSLDHALWAAQVCMASPATLENAAVIKGSMLRTYRLTARYHDGAVSERTGCFYVDCLPSSCWQALFRELYRLRDMRAVSPIFDSYYTKHGSNYICMDPDSTKVIASVMIDGVQYPRYYLSQFDDVVVGMRVRVPFGFQGEERIGTVTHIRRYGVGDFPFPIGSSRSIIAKADPSEKSRE